MFKTREGGGQGPFKQCLKKLHNWRGMASLISRGTSYMHKNQRALFSNVQPNIQTLREERQCSFLLRWSAYTLKVDESFVLQRKRWSLTRQSETFMEADAWLTHCVRISGFRKIIIDMHHQRICLLPLLVIYLYSWTNDTMAAHFEPFWDGLVFSRDKDSLAEQLMMAEAGPVKKSKPTQLQLWKATNRWKKLQGNIKTLQ